MLIPAQTDNTTISVYPAQVTDLQHRVIYRRFGGAAAVYFTQFTYRFRDPDLNSSIGLCARRAWLCWVCLAAAPSVPVLVLFLPRCSAVPVALGPLC